MIPLLTWRRLALAGGAALAVAATSAAGLLRGVELPLRDAMLRHLGARAVAHVAAVVIDEEALAAYGAWPWPRQRLATLLDRVRAAGAGGIVVDVLLVEERDGDADLAVALARGPSAIVAALSDNGASWLRPGAALRAGAAVGHGVFELDHDGVMRRVMSTKQAGGESYPALALAAAALAEPATVVPVGRPLVPGFRARPDSVPTVSAARLLAGGTTPRLAGRVVFVGLAAAGLGDRVVTPVSRAPQPDPGVLVQAAVAEAVLDGDLLRPVAPLVAGLIAALLVVVVLACAPLGGVPRLIGEAAATLAPGVIAFSALALAGAAVPAATLTGLAIAATMAVEVRHGLVAWRHAGTTAALLAAAAGDRGPTPAVSFDGQLDLVERLATEAARQRLAAEESRRVVAHELKTPLTSVRGLSQMLRDLDLPPDERRRAAQLLVSETDRMQGMIERLMDLERLQRRSFATEATAVDLSALVRERAEVLARGHGRAIALAVAAGLAVRGDPGLLERVMDNLLGNAFKFSPPDTEVTVRASLAGRDVVVEVIDRGCGVPEVEREAIFDRFHRGAGAAGREGLGLGLALVREVITWHGGTVAVADAAGPGSSFVVRLPAAGRS